MTISMCKNVSDEDMIKIKKEGKRVTCKDGNLVVTAYHYNDHLYIDDVDYEEKKTDRPEPKKECTQVHTEDLDSDEEIDGTIMKSIISSKLKLHQFGMGLDCILLINRHIEGIRSTLWSYIPLEIRSIQGDEKAEKMLQRMETQLDKQLNDFIGLAEQFSKQAKEFKDDEDVVA